MKIIDDISMIGKALYFQETLIISDTHIGYEETLNKQGVLIPRFQFKEIIQDLESIFKKCKKIKKIIINGDLKHEFGTISETEWRHTIRFLDFLSEKCKNIVLIKGNHDTILGPIAKKRNVKIKDYEIIDKVLFIHGDSTKIPKKQIKTIVIGHEHPAISLKDGAREETFKCFLLGKWKKYNLIVMPSFTPVKEGTDILKGNTLSPFISDLKKFQVYIIGDKIYNFGKLENLNVHISK